MVFARRCRVYYSRLGDGASHGTGARVFIFGSRAAQVCTFDDMGVHRVFRGGHVSMVFLGLLAGDVEVRDERVHRRPEAFRVEEYAGRSLTGLATDS